MNGSENFITIPRSWPEIDHIATSFRNNFVASNTEFFPVMHVLELIMVDRLGLLDLKVCTKQEMGNAEGYTAPDGSFIALPEGVYEGAYNNNPRCRFTVAHELGHWLLHSNRPLGRVPAGECVPAYMLTEPQANEFAANLLAPSSLILSTYSEADLQQRFGISKSAARNRLERIKKSA